MALDPYRSWGYEPVAKLRGYKPAWSEDVFLSGDDLQGDKSLGNSQGNSGAVVGAVAGSLLVTGGAMAILVSIKQAP